MLFTRLLILLSVGALCESLCRREYAKAVYWTGAVFINVSLELMGKGGD